MPRGSEPQPTASDRYSCSTALFPQHRTFPTAPRSSSSTDTAVTLLHARLDSATRALDQAVPLRRLMPDVRVIAV